jgi:hypothetical protein
MLAIVSYRDLLALVATSVLGVQLCLTRGLSRRIRTKT